MVHAAYCTLLPIIINVDTRTNATQCYATNSRRERAIAIAGGITQ